LRHRVGDYRIVYRVVDNRLIVLVLAIGHRRDVYDSTSSSRAANTPLGYLPAGASNDGKSVSGTGAAALGRRGGGKMGSRPSGTPIVL